MIPNVFFHIMWFETGVRMLEQGSGLRDLAARPRGDLEALRRRGQPSPERVPARFEGGFSV